MNKLLLFVFINGVLGQSDFGKSYLGQSKLCKPWACVNNALGLDDSLPSKDQFTPALRSILPPGSWQDVVEDVLDACYAEIKPRRYTRTCPGQALMHCVIDHLIDNCPKDSMRDGNACAPVSSLAGLKYMFSQSRYEKFNESIAHEARPEWFLKHYFSSKCCNLPELYNSTLLSQCGFNTIMHYYDHSPKITNGHKQSPPIAHTTGTPANETVSVVETSDSSDPLDCCDFSEFITPLDRSECGFQTTWSDRFRLNITEVKSSSIDLPVVTTTQRSPVYHDVKVVPLSCEKEFCVFRKLNVLTEAGDVDTDAFGKLLDNFTNTNPNWQKAKARVITKCLTHSIKDYEADCPINKVLSCTFDVLTENCPHTKPMNKDPCKYTSILRHSNQLQNDTLCQINSSKLRKNRRKYCDFPQFVPHEVLAECGVNAVNRIEFVQNSGLTKSSKWTRTPTCKETSPSALCLMSKMNVLNKYNFMDHFMMKDRLTTFTSLHAEWASLKDAYVTSLLLMPLYSDYCASQRKLMNILDSMLMVCPISRRRNTDNCNKLFASQWNSSVTESRLKENLDHKYPKIITGLINPNQLEFTKKYEHFGARMPHVKISGVRLNGGKSIFDHFLFKERHIPRVRILNIRPTKMYKATRIPLIKAPIYVQQAKKIHNDKDQAMEISLP